MVVELQDEHGANLRWHAMRIEVKLDDPEFCDGCPLYKPVHWEEEDGDRYEVIQYCHIPHIDLLAIEEDVKQSRPQACIDAHGK